MESALGRRHASTDSGEQLTLAQIAKWDTILHQLPFEAQPAWAPDPVRLLAQKFFDEHGHLEVQKGQKAVNQEERKLEHELRIVRGALHCDQRDR